MRIKNKRFLVYGLGSSGVSVIQRLLECKAKIFLLDKDVDKLKDLVVKFKVNAYEDGDKIDVVIVSPGISKDDEFILSAKGKGVKIISELEFGYLLNRKAKYVAVTGTNGKTTTVNLLNHILSKEMQCKMLGNVGVPLTTEKDYKDTIVLEVSSFQLEFIDKFRPHISVILNLAPDHLDRYQDEKEYYSFKKRIAKNSKNDILILNADDKNIMTSDFTNCNIYHLSINKFIKRGVYLYNNIIYFVDGGKSIEILSIQDISLVGVHNIYNVMACVCVSKLLNIDPVVIKESVKSFKGLPHRFEFVTHHNGVTIINDSKATNIASVISAMQSISLNSHILLGGSDKGEDFTNLFKLHLPYKYYLYGATANKIYKAACECDMQDKCVVFDTMFDCVRMAIEMAKEGQMIVLCPGCASFDAFKNYEDRGEQFKNFVRSFYEKK